jgi:zinc protease
VTHSTGVRDRLRADSARDRSTRSPRLSEEWRAAQIPTRVATLDNGLTVIAHRDRKAPIVAVYVTYHAGSRDEPQGKSGLAHLFEHLMYAGTRQFPGNTFRHLERLGATSVNALSREDYTAYFATVPKDKLDQALAIEAARMSAAAFDRAEVDRQLEVVRNELLQRESEPYGSINRIIAQAAYPKGHPYARPADGSIDELDHLSLADTINWQRTHYHPANAALVIAGDIKPSQAIARARYHFGQLACADRDIPITATIAKLPQSQRIVIADRAAASRIYLVWNVPRLSAPEYPGLELLIEIIAGGLSSRLWRSLVEGRHLAREIGGELRGRELGSQMVLWATAPDPASMPKLEEAMSAAIRQFGKHPPTSAELDRARFRRFARLLRATERLCGPRSKAELLGTAWTMAGDANAHEKRLVRIASIKPRELCELSRTWLDEHALVIEARAAAATSVRPRNRAATDISAAIRLVGRARATDASPARAPIVGIHHRGSPLCEVRLVIDGGSAQDPPERSGLAGVAIAALTDTGARRGALTIAARLDRFGAQVEGRVRRDASSVRLSALEPTLTAALEVFHDLLDRHLIDDATIERAKAARRALIESEKSRPLDLALRMLPALVYGRDHCAARPIAGIALEVAHINSEEVRALIASWRVECRARLILVGPHSPKKLRELGDHIGAIYSGNGSKITARAATPTPPITHPRVVLIDQPGRSRSAIFAARAIAPRGSSDFAAIAAADTILGGCFTSRLNLNLREAKSWCYGARTMISSDRDTGLMLAHAFVAPERTVAAMTEIEREWRAIVRVTPSELQHATDYLTLRSAADRETAAQLAAAAEDVIVLRLPRSWYRDFSARLRALRPRDVAGACEALFRQPLIWIIVGDAESIAPGMEAAGFRQVDVIHDPELIP